MNNLLTVCIVFSPLVGKTEYHLVEGYLNGHFHHDKYKILNIYTHTLTPLSISDSSIILHILCPQKSGHPIKSTSLFDVKKALLVFLNLNLSSILSELLPILNEGDREAVPAEIEIPTDQVRHPIHSHVSLQTRACVCCVRGNRRTRRKPTQVHGQN